MWIAIKRLWRESERRKSKKNIGYFKFGDSPAVTQNYDYGSYGLLSAHRFSQGKRIMKDFALILMIIHM